MTTSDRRRRSDTYPRVGASRWHKADYGLVLAIAALLALGLVMVYSASLVTAYTLYRNQFFFITKQAVYAMAGLAALYAFMRLDYHRLGVLAQL